MIELDVFFASIFDLLCNLRQLIDILLHVFDLSTLLYLFALDREVQILDALVQVHVLAVKAIVEWADFFDVETNCGVFDLGRQFDLFQIFVSDFARVLFLHFLGKFKAIIYTQLELPARLDSLLALLVGLALLLDEDGRVSDKLLGILVTTIERQNGGFLQQTKLLAIRFIKVQISTILLQIFVNLLLCAHKLFKLVIFGIFTSCCTLLLESEHLSARFDGGVVEVRDDQAAH